MGIKLAQIGSGSREHEPENAAIEGAKRSCAENLCNVRIYYVDNFRTFHRQWDEDALKENRLVRDAKWSEAVAIGSKAFVEEA